MEARLKLAGVGCARGGRQLFQAVDAELGAGDALVVRGPNGVGKSSLLRAIAGLLPVTTGSIERSGAVALADRALTLDTRLPLRAALAFWARLDGGNVERALAMMALDPLAAVPVRLLSSGQRHRAVLARVIASNAPIWLLDEPRNALDTASVALLEAAITAHRAGGGIVVVATHDTLAIPHSFDMELVACPW